MEKESLNYLRIIDEDAGDPHNNSNLANHYFPEIQKYPLLKDPNKEVELSQKIQDSIKAKNILEIGGVLLVGKKEIN